MSKFIVKPYRWWWPPDRRKAKFMQAMIESKLIDEDKIIRETMDKLKDELLYGKKLGDNHDTPNK